MLRNIQRNPKFSRIFTCHDISIISPYPYIHDEPPYHNLLALSMCVYPEVCGILVLVLAMYYIALLKNLFRAQ